MKHTKRSTAVLIAVMGLILAIGACKKKTPPPPPPAPPPPAPTATLRASPTSIQRGESSTLAWRTENATEATIDGLGRVEASGSQAVTPENSTTYRLVARGAGPNAEASARVTVTAPPAPAPPPARISETLEQMFAANVRDIYFDYDKYDIRPDQLGTAQRAAQFLKAHPEIRFTIEGHCDERGSTEYNIALGDNRAHAAQQALAEASAGAGRGNMVSYGKEKPQCMEHSEDCWQRNRRAHFVLQK